MPALGDRDVLSQVDKRARHRAPVGVRPGPSAHLAACRLLRLPGSGRGEPCRIPSPLIFGQVEPVVDGVDADGLVGEDAKGGGPAVVAGVPATRAVGLVSWTLPAPSTPRRRARCPQGVGSPGTVGRTCHPGSCLARSMVPLAANSTVGDAPRWGARASRSWRPGSSHRRVAPRGGSSGRWPGRRLRGMPHYRLRKPLMLPPPRGDLARLEARRGARSRSRRSPAAACMDRRPTARGPAANARSRKAGPIAIAPAEERPARRNARRLIWKLV